MTDEKQAKVRDYLKRNPLVGMNFAIYDEKGGRFYSSTGISSAGQIEVMEFRIFEEPKTGKFELADIVGGYTVPSGLIRYLEASKDAVIALELSGYANLDLIVKCNVLLGGSNQFMGVSDQNSCKFSLDYLKARPTHALGYVAVSDKGLVVPGSFAEDPKVGMHPVWITYADITQRHPILVDQKKIVSIKRRESK